MLMVRAFVRPEKKDGILKSLSKAGFHAATVIDAVGRGKQQGIKIGELVYDEIPKSLILVGIESEARDQVVDIIIKNSKTGDYGAFGDGKIFITKLEEVYTVSSGKTGL
jgi:nitrogen regulatory protein PII 1